MQVTHQSTFERGAERKTERLNKPNRLLDVVAGRTLNSVPERVETG